VAKIPNFGKIIVRKWIVEWCRFVLSRKESEGKLSFQTQSPVFLRGLAPLRETGRERSIAN
jgi:hypothetical protein